MGVPSSTSVLGSLTQSRLVELARGLGVSIPASGRKDVQIARLLDAARLPLPALLGHLYRDELADLVERGYLVTTGAGAGTGTAWSETLCLYLRQPARSPGSTPALTTTGSSPTPTTERRSGSIGRLRPRVLLRG